MQKPILHIYRASKGRWGKIRPAIEISWISEYTGKKVKPPKSLACEGTNHIGRKRIFPIKDIYYQDWELTKREIRQAIKENDTASLMPMRRFICKECTRKMGGRGEK